MADQKVSALATQTGANVADGDLFPLVDISDTSMAATGTDEKITAAELAIAMGSRIGIWQDWTPTLSQGVSTDITKTIGFARYTQIGKTVMGTCRLTATAAGTAGSEFAVSVPVSSYETALAQQVGTAFVSNGGVNFKALVRITGGANVFAFTRTDDGTTSTPIGVAPSVAIASGNIMTFTFLYEAA